MKRFLDWLSGKKTYVVACAAGIYAVGIQRGAWEHAAWLDVLFGATATATMRAGVAKAASQAAALLMLCLSMLFVSGCATTSTVDPATGQTNVVTQVDPVKLATIRQQLEPTVSLLISKAIARSPQHAADIKEYAAAISTIFCAMQTNNEFSITYLVEAADMATVKLQQRVAANEEDWTAEIIAAKGVLVSAFVLATGDSLTWQLPQNIWLNNFCGLLCDLSKKAAQ